MIGSMVVGVVLIVIRAVFIVGMLAVTLAARVGMSERESRGVEGLPSKQGGRRRQRRVLGTSPVERIAYQRRTCIGEVNTDLMSSSRLEPAPRFRGQLRESRN